MGPLTPVIGTMKIASPSFSIDEWHIRSDSGRPMPMRLFTLFCLFFTPSFEMWSCVMIAVLGLKIRCPNHPTVISSSLYIELALNNPPLFSEDIELVFNIP
ncbi:conserved hypothetical protein [Ricinus communis]|uniref:Uncharacterized protein n=1 Tax=Ricinus communis TaxID=3988 RepID=B9T4K5_RICCO|nr:conserved hypothetical protein [Ricinus communis]